MGAGAVEARVRRAQGDLLSPLSSASPADLVVAGAGMAGLCAAARAAELGARVVVYEKGPTAGGSMRLSSGVVWRYLDEHAFRSECPGGEPGLQQLVLERLDAALEWLESLGAPVVERVTHNERTVGMRFDPAGLARALAARVGVVRFGEPLTEIAKDVPLVLATGGFQGDPTLVRRFVAPAAQLPLRANRWSAGDGIRLGLGRGGALSVGMGEFYGRSMPVTPTPIPPKLFVSLAQVYARHAAVQGVDGVRYACRPRWHEVDVVQWIARRPRALAWYVVDDSRLSETVGTRTVGDAVDAARRAGGVVHEVGGTTRVLVQASITATLGGLRADRSARVLDRGGQPVPLTFVAGGDAGGMSAGGWSSGLAAALVLGLTAAEAALGSDSVV